MDQLKQETWPGQCNLSLRKLGNYYTQNTNVISAGRGHYSCTYTLISGTIA